MLVLSIVIHYDMVCLTTVLIDYNKKNSAMHIFCKIAKFYHIKLMDFHCLPVRQRSLNFSLLGIL